MRSSPLFPLWIRVFGRRGGRGSEWPGINFFFFENAPSSQLTRLSNAAASFITGSENKGISSDAFTFMPLSFFPRRLWWPKPPFGAGKEKLFFLGVSLRSRLFLEAREVRGIFEAERQCLSPPPPLSRGGGGRRGRGARIFPTHSQGQRRKRTKMGPHIMLVASSKRRWKKREFFKGTLALTMLLRKEMAQEKEENILPFIPSRD